MKIFIGLGNPTSKYENTRHNIGFMAIDYIINQLNLTKEWKTKFESEYIKTRYENEVVLFVKPQTYMNNSGLSIRKWCDYFDVSEADVFVFYDDMDIPFSKFKLKTGGSAGGHNGIKSTIEHLGTQQFHRIRLGIGRPPRDLMIDFVLSKFSKKELTELLTETFPKAFDLFEEIFQKPFRDLMAVYNQKTKKE